VHLYVNDINDNPPIFEQNEYVANISETATVGTSVLKVRAVSMDTGMNALIRYYLIATADVLAKFQLDVENGTVTIH
jgi:hypothetical protein